MKARVHADLDTTAGVVKAGTILEGDEALRMIQAGHAVPHVEKREVKKADAESAKTETR